MGHIYELLALIVRQGPNLSIHGGPQANFGEIFCLEIFLLKMKYITFYAEFKKIIHRIRNPKIQVFVKYKYLFLDIC